MRKWTLKKRILRIFARLGGVFIVTTYWNIIKVKRPRARAIILDKNKSKILLIKNITSKEFQLPGGGIKKNENAEDATLREVREELSLAVHILYKLGTYFDKKRKSRIEIFVTQADIEHFVMEWELDDAKWFPLHALPSNIKKTTKQVLRDFLAHNEPVSGIWE